jgi:hypothetical protein
MNKEVLLRARQLIEAKEYQKARALLQTIPNDPIAQKWLATLNQSASNRLESQLSTSPPKTSVSSSYWYWIMVYAAVTLILASVAGLAYVYVHRDQDDDADIFPREAAGAYLVRLADFPNRAWTISEADFRTDRADVSPLETYMQSCGFESGYYFESYYFGSEVFDRVADNLIVYEYIEVFESPDVAQDILDVYQQIVDTCTGGWVDALNGARIQFAAIPDLHLGESTVAYHFIENAHVYNNNIFHLYGIHFRYENKIVSILQIAPRNDVLDYSVWGLVGNITLERMGATNADSE